jgi:hypothetical protein
MYPHHVGRPHALAARPSFRLADLALMAGVIAALTLGTGNPASAAASKFVPKCPPKIVQACPVHYKLQCQAHDSKGCCTKVKCVHIPL